MKWVVVEIQDRKMVIENEKGQYKILKYQDGYEVGQEINLYDLASIRRQLRVKKIAVILISMVLGSGIGIYMYYLPHPILCLGIQTEHSKAAGEKFSVDRPALFEPPQENNSPINADGSEDRDGEFITRDRNDSTVREDVYGIEP